MKSGRRRFSRKFIQILPDQPRAAIVRTMTTIDPDWPSSLEIKIASSEDELLAAYRLLHDSYVGAGYMKPDASKMRVISQHILPQSSTIVAKWDGQVIGTVTLIRDNAIGLPIEKIFNMAERRKGGRRIAEVSSLAIDPRFRGQGSQTLFPLMRFVYQYAKHYFGTHELVIAVNPATVDIYICFLMFERLSARSKPYDFVMGAPAVGLFLDFSTCELRWQKTFSHRPIEQNFFKYWTEIPTSAGNNLPQRKYHSSADIVLTPQLLKDFYLDKAGLTQKLSYNDISVLLNAYPFAEFQKVLLPLQQAHFRKTARMETQMTALINELTLDCEVLDVSAKGLLIRSLPDSLNTGQIVEIHIWLNHIISTTLQVQVLWSAQKDLYGLKILKGNKAWNEMIEFLESQYSQTTAKKLKIA